MSIAGGVHRALERGASIGCESLQIFLKSNRQWVAPPLSAVVLGEFHQLQESTKIRPVFAHSSYLLNIAATTTQCLVKSIGALVDEIERAAALRVPFIVLHPGAHMGAGEAAGLRTAAASLNEVFCATPRQRVRIALEITTGQGTCLGYRFEHLAELFQIVDHPKRLAVCVDTCHLFAAGYDIRTQKGYEATIHQLLRLIGHKQIVAFHLNDSQTPLGSRIDRHEHIGKGHLGLAPFRWLLNDPRWRDLPMVLETPKEDDDRMIDDVNNLRVLRSLLMNR